MWWSIDADPLVVLHAKPQMVKDSKYLTFQPHDNNENVCLEKIYTHLI